MRELQKVSFNPPPCDIKDALSYCCTRGTCTALCALPLQGWSSRIFHETTSHICRNISRTHLQHSSPHMLRTRSHHALPHLPHPLAHPHPLPVLPLYTCLVRILLAVFFFFFWSNKWNSKAAEKGIAMK